MERNGIGHADPIGISHTSQSGRIGGLEGNHPDADSDQRCQRCILAFYASRMHKRLGHRQNARTETISEPALEKILGRGVM
jgi:hypothetical protein